MISPCVLPNMKHGGGGVGVLSWRHCRTMTQHTSRLYQGYLTNKKSDGVLHQMTGPLQSSNLNPIEMVWDELDRRVKENQPTSAQHI
uniref:Tc1-like transposase DDE domain-containing protein n=1 Tax=Oncorhynchus tshawytscha TaxID=74940 RepID=A0AAZ3PB46_ONCTS